MNSITNSIWEDLCHKTGKSRNSNNTIVEQCLPPKKCPYYKKNMSEEKNEMGSRVGKEGRAEAWEQDPIRCLSTNHLEGARKVHPRSIGTRRKLFSVMLWLLYLTFIGNQHTYMYITMLWFYIIICQLFFVLESLKYYSLV